MQNRFMIISFALSRKGKYRHSFTPQSTITNQKTRPAWKMLFASPIFYYPSTSIFDSCDSNPSFTYLLFGVF